MAIDDDVRGALGLEDPHTFFRRLREHDPVHWSDASRAWILTSHAAVSEAFRDPKRLSSDRLSPLEEKMPPGRRRAMAETFQLLRGWMVFRDEPEHRRLRDPVRRQFTPRAIERLAARIQEVVDGLLDALATKDEAELIADFAFPLPAIVIAELLGVPQEDRARFQQWSRQLSGIVFGAVEQPDRDLDASRGAHGFTEYFGKLVRRYEKEPADNLLSALVAASREEGSLPPEELAGACTMLLFAGHETTTSLISSGMACLFDHPDELRRLREEPGLAASAVEELLRFEGPTKIMVRLVRGTHERGGHRLAAGDRVYLSVAGANRDPAVFSEPDRLDPAREPNPHLAFGLGSHFCLGADLARVEARIAIASLLARFPKIRPATDRFRWISTIIGRGVTSVPVQLS